MVKLLIDLLNARKNRLLLVAEAALSHSQFIAFRKLFLDEFGKNGFESEILDLLNKSNLNESDRNGQEHIMHGRRCNHD